MDKRFTPSPIHLLAGGPGSRHETGDPVLTRILASLGVAHPSIAYIGAASDDDRSFFIMISDYLKTSGAGRVLLAPLAGIRSGIEKTRAILESADLVFISGGDVESGMRILEERRIVSFLRQLYENGKPFFGLSAGSIMLAKQWVRWENPDDDTTASAFPCLGLARIICDTHSEAEHWQELRALLRLSPDGVVGYGIPSGAGLRVHPDGTAEALGAAVVRYVNKADKVALAGRLSPRDSG